MRVVIEPINDSPFFATMMADPTYSFNIFGGCLTASLPCALSDRQRASLALAKVSLYGSDGLVWGGFVWDMPKHGEPLVALGPNCGLAMGPIAGNTNDHTINEMVSAILASGARCPTWLLPAADEYRDWVKTGSYNIVGLNIVDGSQLDFIQSVLAFGNDSFGWYPEWVNGARHIGPHLYAQSTTPDYVLALRDASQMLDGGSMEPLASSVRVVFNNGASAVDVTDTDPTHLLVKLGRVKWATIDVATTDTTAASTAGAKYLTEAGREQIKGSTKHLTKKQKAAERKRLHNMSHKERSAYNKQAHKLHALEARRRSRWRRNLATAKGMGADAFGVMGVGGNIPAGLVRTLNGATVPYSSIRPGQMLRMFTHDGIKDATIREVTCVGERSASITVDNSPNRLDILLARIAAKTAK